MRPKFIEHHNYLIRLTLLTLALLLATGCSLLPGEDSPTPDAVATSHTVALVATPTATLPPTLSPTTTPEPTPIVPTVTVADQSVGEDGVVIIDEATLPEPGWLAVFATSVEEPGQLLGYVDLPEGVHRNVRITIDPFQATETLVAELHSNAGDLQVLELPEPDGLMSDSSKAEFAVDVALPQASITMDDQAIGSDGMVSVGSVSVLEPTWVVIHADEAGAVGRALGQVLLEPGEYADLSIPIRWQQGTPLLHAVLHEDTGEIGYMDYPLADPPLLANGAAVATSFNATFPPDILVYDQPVLDSSVVIERVISDGPGWLVVHYDDNGEPGLIIGNAPLKDGLNEQVEVKLIEAALTPRLYVRVHQDSTPGDSFNFPEADPPIMFEGRLPQAQSFRTDVGSYVVVHDQQLSEQSEILVSAVIVASDAWLVIHDDLDGSPGQILGQSFIPAGISRDVVVALDPAPSPGVIHAVLNQDAGEPQVFEWPDGVDIPIRVQGRTVDVPFQIIAPGE